MFNRDVSEEGPVKTRFHERRGDSDTSFDDDDTFFDPEGTNTSTGKSEQPVQQGGWLDYMKQLWDSIRLTLFVVGSALVVFIAARNSVTW